MKLASQRVCEALEPLDMRLFNTLEEVQDAVFPLFGKLQDLFLGEGHRDLVDRLINAGWITKNPNGTYCIELPKTFAEFPVSKPKPPVASKSELSFREIFWLVTLNSNSTGVLRNSGIYMPNLRSLVEKGLVEYVDIVEKKTMPEEMARIKTDAITAIVSGKYTMAVDLCNDLEDLRHAHEDREMVYRLTQKGRDFLTSQPDSTSGVETA